MSDLEPGSEARSWRGPSRSPADLLDEAAELRDLIVQIGEAEDLGFLSGLLARLHSLLEGRFSRGESPECVDQGMGGDATVRPVDGHEEILAAVRDLIRRVQADTRRPVATVRGEVAALLARLERRGFRYLGGLGDRAGAERGAAQPPETPSKALEVNLRRTAVEVVIPEAQRVLLDVTANRYGLQENTNRLLREINHPFVNWSRALEDLHRRAMSDFAHHVGHKRAAEAVGVFCGLYLKAAEEASSSSLQETAVRDCLFYLEKVARDSGSRLPRILPTIERALEGLDGVFARDPGLAVAASPRSRRVAEALLAAAPGSADGALQRSLELLASSLGRVYERWLACEDPAAWWREGTGAVSAARLPEKVAAISHARLEACREELERLTASPGALQGSVDALLALPDDAQIQRGYLDAAACVESETNQAWQNQLERIRWLIKVLSVEALAAVHEQALSEINHSYLDVLRGGDRRGLELLVRETFASLQRSELASSPTALNLIAKIGGEVLATRDTAWAELVVGEMLDWNFPNPDFSGFTDDWQVQVNPAHLRAIRAYLAVIEADPELARLLIAALVVQLKIGGVFIADTDLFQKDVSKLLNSGIGPVYHQIKHLLKIFPVYFRDIGAEGELREVSSRIDDIEARRDPLCHFLRKQSHVESNPLLIGFIEAIGHFWATGEKEPLLPYVPPSLYERLDIDNEVYSGLRRIFAQLVGPEGVSALFDLEPLEFERRLKEISDGSAVDREKAVLFFRLRKLIGQKYELEHGDLLEQLHGFHRIDDGQVEKLRTALAENHHEVAVETLLSILEELKDIIVSEERTEGIEDIYYKRHIAVGIPSMYGRYREEKFEAVGLTFRIESLANALFEHMIVEQNLEYMNRNTLRKVARWLRLMLRALRIDGFKGRSLSTGMAMLDQALVAEGISVDQYVNIFQFISHGVEQVIRIRFLEVYESVLERLLRRMLRHGVVEAEEGSDAEETILKVSETFLRDLISQSFGLQQLDNLVAKVLRALVEGREKFDRETRNLLMTYDADRCFVPIDERLGPHDGAIYLGNKGYMIKRLAHEGISVPHGFIITTEVFRCREAIRACDELQREVTERIRKQVARLEGLTGFGFGNPRRPLLLSVRSGSTMSMPGVLDTFLDVGINEDIAEGFAARWGSPWGAWDGYRRFLQFWGMGHGLDRNLFDALMREAKQSFGVEKKSHLPAGKMKELALRYRQFLLDHGVAVTDDPFEQLRMCVNLVMDSWHSEKARIYRKETQVAEEWGTAVIVQCMVYGNLNGRSGTGVVLTYNPRQPAGGVRLHGDFAVQGQGDDVVCGLVETFPISEEQRLSEAKGAALSLEKDFPRLYQVIDRHARTLIHDRGMFHQQMEFTFESDDPQDLYILQTRDTVISSVTWVPAFLPSDALERSKVATGIGAGGGALTGRVAHTSEDIAELRRRFPEEAIILLRPDTVPDDIPLLLQSDGMVTAIGGATSHAAVVAQRLGRTCVVGCRQLQVHEDERWSDLEGRVLRTADLISINGSDGSVYLGRHPSTMVRRQTLA